MRQDTLRIVGGGISQGIRYRLFEVDQALSGVGGVLRLAPDDYEKAKRAIVELFVALEHARWEETPHGRALDAARGDQPFQ